MKIRQPYILSAVCLTGVLVTGCNGLSKMLKDASKITYSVKPNPLQDNGDSVAINITASYPAKYFNKKAVVTVIPTLKFSDGSAQALKTVTLVGESASQSGQKINYDQGGTLNYTEKVAYTPNMRDDELDLNATLENNKKSLPLVKLADGTIVTASLLQKDARPILGKDNFTKTTPEKDTALVFYAISSSYLRPAELDSKEMKEFKKFVEDGVNNGFMFHGIDMSAYASPDGETDMNQHLAEDRAKSAITGMQNMFKGMNSKKLDTKFGEERSFYTVGQTGMDWEGFQSKVKSSDIKDKDLILRVLSMYTDHDQRMKEIKNMSATYTELASKILPELRRSMAVLNAEKKSRTDDEIRQLVTSNPAALSVEEILYAATLTSDVSQKLSIYKTVEKQYPNDWRGFNNSGYEEIVQNEVDAANADISKAAQLSPSNPIIENNLGAIALMKGDTKSAAVHLKNASSAGPEVSYNLGMIDIKQGNYADAAGKMSGVNSFNSALAMLLNGDVQGAQSNLDASGNRSGIAFYLKAIISARGGNKSDVMSNLQQAINQDANLKTMAATDCEFIKFRTDKDFQSLTGAH